MTPTVSRSSYEVTLLEENQELRDSNKYLREKLKEAYEGRDSQVYINLRDKWQDLLYHSKVQQDEILRLSIELGKTRMRNW